MGLSSKQVSRDGHGWSQTLLQAQTLEPPALMNRPTQQSQNQQQRGEPLKCPRCDSTNTKFCYYNNYNKSQPRHFCKTCKRHWTKGGTLRNVPVGGGRKNKRIKTSNAAAAATSTSTGTTPTASRVGTHVTIQSQQQRQNLAFTLGDQKKLSDVLYQSLIHPTSNLEIKDMSTNNFRSLIPQNQSLNIPYASTSSFYTTPSTIPTSFQLSNIINYPAEETIEKPTNIMSSTSMPVITSSSVVTQPWQVASTSSVMDNMTTYWNWDDIDPFVSTDLNIPWDDSDIKP